MEQSNYQRLVGTHGTYADFVTAAWNTLGECSVDEINEACRKYREDLSAARIADEKALHNQKDSTRGNNPDQPG